MERKRPSLLLEPFHDLVLNPHLAIWAWEWFQHLADGNVKFHHWHLMLPFPFLLSAFASLSFGEWKMIQKGKENTLRGRELCFSAWGSFERDKLERGSQTYLLGARNAAFP